MPLKDFLDLTKSQILLMQQGLNQVRLDEHGNGTESQGVGVKPTETEKDSSKLVQEANYKRLKAKAEANGEIYKPKFSDIFT